WKRAGVRPPEGVCAFCIKCAEGILIGVKPAANLVDYLSNPFGRYLAGRTWAHFFAERDLCGLALWDRPDVEQVREMVAAIAAEEPQRSPVHKSIIDARRLTGIDPAAFHEFSKLMGVRGTELGPRVTHHAIVRPRGIVGATVSGFYYVTPTNFPDRIKVFDTMEEALHWMGQDAVPVVAAVDAMVESVRAIPAALQTVRKLIAEVH